MKTGQTFMTIGVMRQKFKHVSLLLLLSLGALVGGIKTYQNGAPSYPQLSCERLELKHDNQPIIGAEDMAYDPQSGFIYISAYERREKRAGGIYRFHNETPQNIEKVTSIVVDYPHGLTLQRSGSDLTLSLIARDLSNPKIMAASLRRFTSKEEGEFSEIMPAITDSSLCAANNLITLHNTEFGKTEFDETGLHQTNLGYLVTQDHQSCSLAQQGRENIFNPKSGSLTYFGPKKESPALKDLYFANGITANNRNIFVAETRAKQISIYQNDGALSPSHTVKLPGGPDNLTLNEAGEIIAALHPNLIGFAAYRAGWGPRVKSRFAIMSAQQSLTTYDVGADILSGATVALQVKDDIYLGAAYDAGIARCYLSANPTKIQASSQVNTQIKQARR